MSSVDIRVCVNELKDLIGARVGKIYHYPPNEIRIKLHKLGRRDITIEAGKRVHLTKYAKEVEGYPTGFAMILRKYLEGGRLKDISQYYFDRIIVLKIEREEERYLISELFLKGNIVLLDNNFNVIMALRGFKPGEKYNFPTQEINILDMNYDDFISIVMQKNKEIVKILASDLRLGRIYAEELCLRSNIDKKILPNQLDDADFRNIFKELKHILDCILNNREIKPNIVYKNSQFVDVQPLELKLYKDFDKKYFEKFNDALDEFYLKFRKEEYDENKEKLEKRLAIQLETKKEYERKIEAYKMFADFIYENYQILHTVLDLIKENKIYNAEEILDAHNLNYKVKDGKSLVLEFNNLEVELDPSKTLHQIASELYEKSKKIKNKLNRLLEAIENTKKELSAIKPKIQKISIVRKREWFEKFRWFFTSDGYLVIGGRNAEMNKEIVSKYLENNDLFFHTQTPGGPATILKNGQNAPESSIIEAAQFAASYSALWKEGKFKGEVYYVKPDQVKKSAKAGEYLPKGSFYIIGKREYIDVPLSCAIGVELDKFRIIGGPSRAIKKHSDYHVEIEIGDKDPNTLAFEISAKLVEMASEDEKHLIKAIANPSEIVRFLPPGKSRIKS